MRVLEKNTKAFTILELIVVLTIIGIVSAVAYPNFSSWNKERKVRSAVNKILSIVKNIQIQTQQGTFAYVQVKFTNTDKYLQVETKGMTMDTLASKINDGDDPWNQAFPDNVKSRCSLDEDYWDTDAADAGEIKNFVSKTNFSDITASMKANQEQADAVGGEEGDAVPVDMLGDDDGAGAQGDVGAVCFSRNGKFYEANAGLLSNSNKPYDFIYICRRVNEGEDCNVGYSDSDLDKELPPGTDDEGNTAEYLNAIKWSRFGNFAITKWSGSGWIE